MNYKNYLKKLKKCPFCNLSKSEIILENSDAILTLAKAPYVRGHLIVFPKKHHVRLNSLSERERKSLLDLLEEGFRRLQKIEKKSISILYREGNKKNSGKSVSHLHIHLIPKMRIGGSDINMEERKIYTKKEYLEEINREKRRLK